MCTHRGNGRAAAVILWLLFPATAQRGWAQEKTDLRSVIEQQSKQIAELTKQIDARLAAPQQAEAKDPAAEALDPNAVKKIVADYLKENPGAGMPPSVQTGYSPATGFVIRSAPNPKYINWEDDCKIPFELRIHGRLQLAYYYYKVTDRVNHLTNIPATQNANSVRLADFSQLEAKRVQLTFEGTAFDPDLPYHFRLPRHQR